MKNLTVSMPEWYIERMVEYGNIIKRALERECFRILAYSKVVKKIVVAAYDNCDMREVYGIYDFDKRVFHQVGNGVPTFIISDG